MNRRRLALLMILGLVAASAAGYAYFQFLHVGLQLTYKDISVADTKAMIESNPSLLILDVRTAQEYTQEHLNAAINIPLSDLSSRTGELEKNRQVLVYCQSGSRSAQASDILVKAGFTNVYNMSGGMTSWINAGYPTVTQ